MVSLKVGSGQHEELCLQFSSKLIVQRLVRIYIIDGGIKACLDNLPRNCGTGVVESGQHEKLAKL